MNSHKARIVARRQTPNSSMEKHKGIKEKSLSAPLLLASLEIAVVALGFGCLHQNSVSGHLRIHSLTMLRISSSV